jgi:hypothetical protein
MTPRERVEQLTTCCPHLARNLSLLTEEQLAQILTEEKEPSK